MATYQSLYRRYRPQRFDEVLGQGHVTRALRNAVRESRVGHAYLFSGPRGTGKTSTARILAKVLNCAAPDDGEPCGVCENCVAVAEGRVTDWLLEQDAASKSKVDDMRDLLERVPLGTSGNRKVIILDEVHMLSQGAENALLKTLEEPPAHVVFVLATTDPQKVRPTIRSRTQHFEFRLLPPDVLAEHVRHVIAHAGLALDPDAVEEAVEHVLRSGGGSARDTLSALDQVAALGEVVDERQPVDAVLDALCDRDAGQVLVAVADALAAGREPRALGEALIAALRDAFLSLMGVADDHLPPAASERAARVGERLGAAGLTRALDVLGEALTELSRKPDPRIVVEVALVRLTQPSADRTLDAVIERLDRLERAVSAGGLPPAAGDRPPPDSGQGAEERGAGDAPAAPAPVRARGRPRSGAAAARDALTTARGSGRADDAPPAETGGGRQDRPTLGAVTRGRRRSGGAPASAPSTAGSGGSAGEAGDEPPPAGAGPSPRTVATGRAPAAGSSRGPGGADTATAGPERAPAGGSSRGPGGADTATAATAPPPGTGEGASEPPTLGEVEAAWSGGVLAGLPVKVRSKWRGGRWTSPLDGALRFAVPNAWHQNACNDARRDVEQALAAHFGRTVTVTVVVDEGDGHGGAAGGTPPGGAAGPTASGTTGRAPSAPPEEEHVDLDDLRDADDAPGGGVDMLLREFGGGEVIEESP
ncbi:MAG TPA: DNA polymerase III subunit gamma/tau [Acidimicrobiales bacterium]